MNDSSIIDNHAHGTVGGFLRDAISENSEISIVSAYFTIYAYHHLKKNLDEIKNLRFLFGEPSFIKSLDPEKRDSKGFGIEDETLTISLESRLMQKAVAKDCAEWIKAKVHIRSIAKPNFLHGKLYHIRQANGMTESLTGSSNFTVSGLGLSRRKNIELNMVINDRRDSEDLKSWFDELWNNTSGLVKDVKEDVLNYLEQVYAENDPEFVYFKTLFHIFEAYVSEQEKGLLTEKTGFFDSEIWNMLYDFQKDGVKGAINKILKHNGCIIADSVGLGKTFEALAVIRYFELLNARVLLLCPKKLKENWTIYQAHKNHALNQFTKDRFSYSVMYHTDLNRISGKTEADGIDLSNFNWGAYDLVVIDESHNFRNNIKSRKKEDGERIISRYERLMDDIIKSGVKTKVLLLSATPVNNNLKDLRNQIYFITEGEDGALSGTTGIRDIGLTLKNAQTQFTVWADPRKNSRRTVKDLLERLDSSFFKLLDELTIARSRQHIEKYYDIASYGKFPQRLPVISVYPNIDSKKRFPSYDKLNQEIMNYKLSLFNPSAYIKEEFKALYEEKAGRTIRAFTQERREHYLIGMMKVNFLKRLESSVESFEISMERTIKKIEELENKIKNFKERELDLSSLTINDEEDEELAEVNADWQVGKKIRFDMKHLKLDEWLEDLNKDKDQLINLYNNAVAVTPDRDEKLFELKKIIQEKIENPLNSGNKKVLIFTAFADTALYLYENLKEWSVKKLKLHIAIVSGGSVENKTSFIQKGFKRQSDFNAILTNFSPVSKKRSQMKDMPQEGEIDILIATDCISEGQNLQDCDFLINYDIHWNPVRIIQRFGRIDRLASKNEKIRLVNFWSTKDLDNYINLKERVEARMALVDIAATGEENLLNSDQIEDLIAEDLKFRHKQLKKLQKEVLDLEDVDENISLSEFTLDDFRMELIRFLEKNRKKLEYAPLGLYGVVPSPSGDYREMADYRLKENEKEIIKPGVIFCLKQKGHTEDNKAVNPLQPYFLVYVRNDGSVRFNYTHPKQILEIFKLLCSGKKEPFEKLCDLFNAETLQGENMIFYNKMLKKGIESVRSVFKKQIAQRLLFNRDARIPLKSEQIGEDNPFELITWLVIK